jgi:hypothetical protein
MGGIDVRPFPATVCNITKQGKLQKYVRKVSFSFERTPVFLLKRPKKGVFFVSVLNCLELRVSLVIAGEEIALVYGITVFEQEFAA